MKQECVFVCLRCSCSLENHVTEKLKAEQLALVDYKNIYT